MWGGNGGILTLTPHGEVLQDSPDTEQRGRRQGRRLGDICGVIYVDTEVGGMTGEIISGKEKHPRETAGALHVSTLEG